MRLLQRVSAGSRFGAAWLLGGILATSAPAQEPVEAVWHFGDESVDLRALVDLCSDAFGRVIEYDPEVLEGLVWLSSASTYTSEDVWLLLNRELASRKATTVQPPGSESLRIVPIEAAAGLARLERGDLEGARAGFVKLLVPVEHRSVAALAETASPLLSASGKVTAVKDGKALIVADFSAHAEQVLSLVKLLDQREVEPEVREFRLEHVPPLAIGTLLEQLTNTREKVVETKLRGSALPLAESQSVLVVAPEEEIGWWADMIERFDRPEPVYTQQYTPRRFGLLETAGLIEEVVRGRTGPEEPGAWRMVSDQLTGTLVITASPSQHREVQELLNRLENTEFGARKPLRAFTLRNRQVSEVLELLQALLEAGVLVQPDDPGPDGEPPVKSVTSPVPATFRPPGQVRKGENEPEVTLTADEGTNRILAFGPASLLDQVGGLIETLDVRHAQVLVETLVVVLNEDQTRALGVELQGLRAEGDAIVGLASLFGLGSPDPTSLALPAASGTGFSTTVLDPGDFSAVVRALATLSEGRSLTVPKVLVNNNAEANLDSTLQTPYASTNASNTVATTSFGGTFDAGTSITVKPQIADGDQIVMDYSVSLSRFTGEAADPNLPPPRQETKLQSTVTVPDGYTIVIGGLEIDSETDTVAEVPVLGQIPLIEHLFQDRSRTESKSRFFVFLRCTVMRSGSFEDLKFTSEESMAAADVDDGWPKLEPRVIR